MSRFRKAILVVGALLAVGATQAQAGFVPTLTTPAPGGTASTFVYNLTFTSGSGPNTETLVSGNFVQLYNFFSPGVVAGSPITITGPAGLTASITNTPTVPPGTVPNLPLTGTIVFTYNGPALTADTSWQATIPLTGQLFATRVGQSGSINQIGTGPFNNNQIGGVFLPSPVVPEPTSFVLGAFALPLLVFLRRRRSA